MKKLLLTIALAFLIVLPTFSAENISTSQLNKQGWEYIKQNNYDSAFNSFSKIYKLAKTQEDYSYVLYGFLELIKNENIPSVLRVDLCLMLTSKDFTSKITDDKLSNINFAIWFKMINILSKTSPNDMTFTELMKEDKQTVLSDYKIMYLSGIKEAKTPNQLAISRLYYALYKYSIGSNTAIDDIEKELNNIANRGTKYDYDSTKELVNLVLNWCK